MKITAIQTHVLQRPGCRIGFRQGSDRSAGACGDGARPRWSGIRGGRGSDPGYRAAADQRGSHRVEHLWQIVRQHFWHGNGIIRATAMSGIDLALWDIVGKIHNVPCHKLWGGPVRDYIRTYCHLGGGKWRLLRTRPGRRDAILRTRAKKRCQEGFTAFKTMAVP